MKKTSRTAILIQSFWKHKRMALDTCVTIEQRWPQHPSVFIGGCDENDALFLKCSDVTASWIAVTKEAVEQLQNKGFEQIYLILEDHPPLNACNADYLNNVLPTFMREKKATYIGLRGPDQRTQIPVIKKSYYSEAQLIKGDPKYLCNLSLHPALWNTGALLKIFNSFIKNTSEEKQTAWYFEKRSRDANFIDSWIKESTYRVIGSKSTINKGILQKVKKEKIKHLLTGKRKSPEYRAIGAYYEGPYPMVFAGLLARGKTNSDFEILKELGIADCKLEMDDKK